MFSFQHPCLLANLSSRFRPDSRDGINCHLRKKCALRPEDLGAHRSFRRVYEVRPGRFAVAETGNTAYP